VAHRILDSRQFVFRTQIQGGGDDVPGDPVDGGISKRNRQIGLQLFGNLHHRQSTRAEWKVTFEEMLEIALQSPIRVAQQIQWKPALRRKRTNESTPRIRGKYLPSPPHETPLHGRIQKLLISVAQILNRRIIQPYRHKKRFPGPRTASILSAPPLRREQHEQGVVLLILAKDFDTPETGHQRQLPNDIIELVVTTLVGIKRPPVRAGEASGALDVVLGRLAEYGEHEHVICPDPRLKGGSPQCWTPGPEGASRPTHG